MICITLRKIGVSIFPILTVVLIRLLRLFFFPWASLKFDMFYRLISVPDISAIAFKLFSVFIVRTNITLLKQVHLYLRRLKLNIGCLDKELQIKN